MADSFIELTRVDAEPHGTSVLVNLGGVAWIEGDERGLSRIVFAAGRPHERAVGMPLEIVVRETLAEIALLAGVVQKTNRSAIAQAWADQRGRRDIAGNERS
jgi:hypothetical protein